MSSTFNITSRYSDYTTGNRRMDPLIDFMDREHYHAFVKSAATATDNAYRDMFAANIAADNERYALAKSDLMDAANNWTMLYKSHYGDPMHVQEMIRWGETYNADVITIQGCVIINAAWTATMMHEQGITGAASVFRITYRLSRNEGDACKSIPSAVSTVRELSCRETAMMRKSAYKKDSYLKTYAATLLSAGTFDGKGFEITPDLAEFLVNDPRYKGSSMPPIFDGSVDTQGETHANDIKDLAFSDTGG